MAKKLFVTYKISLNLSENLSENRFPAILIPYLGEFKDFSYFGSTFELRGASEALEEWYARFTYLSKPETTFKGLL